MNILHAVLRYFGYCVVQVLLADDGEALELVDHRNGRKFSIVTDGWSEAFPFLVSCASPHRIMLRIVNPYAYFANPSSRFFGLQLCADINRITKDTLYGLTRREWCPGPTVC